ncbi:MAG TPA: lipid kinase [Clostridiaceae bacterium]|nr:lipid kinase [Clostridiaceae bacterium]
MEKINLIYNPGAGDRSFKNRLDEVVEEFQRKGFQVVPYKTLGVDDIDYGVRMMSNDQYSGVAVAGGDGTINRVINSMLKYQVNLPIGIFPWGTANDLASYFGIDRNVKKCCSNIINGKQKPIDLGKINDKYFVNVAAGGLLTDVSQKIDINLKNTLGKLAYYLKGLEQLPNFRPIPVKFETNDSVINSDIFLFMVFNGRSAGGFNMLAKDAKIDDGKLDMIAIKACTIVDLLPLFIKILKGEHLQDDNVIYIKTDRLNIDCDYKVETDIDGEAGPMFPVKFSVLHNAVNIFVP